MQPITLTSQSEELLRTGIRIRDLPKTFKDAVFVCLKLNIRYLWIDSMCIFQDDLSDWHAQAAMMRQVYASASANIAATSAADGTVGLDFERYPLAVPPILIRPEPTPPPNIWDIPQAYYVCPENRDLADGVLNSRGWVAQERCLSTRIMHFTSTGVVWECQTHVANEAFVEGFPQSSPQPDGISRFANLKRFITGNTPCTGWTAELYKAWIDFVSHYSGCGLTVETDRLVAINGIAQDIAQLTGDTFACGLWKANLTRHLLWQRTHQSAKKRTEWHAPSWSWASSTFAVHYHHHLNHDGCTDIRDYAILETLDLSTQVSGQVDRATLKLRGKLVYATLSVANRSNLLEGEADIIYRDEVDQEPGDTCFVFASLDDIEVPLPYAKDLVFVAIMGCYHGEDPAPMVSYALMLEPTNDEAEAKAIQYRRVGLCRLNRSIYNHYQPNETTEEHTITIV